MGSGSNHFALAVLFREGAMTRNNNKKELIKNDVQRQLDISENTSHNKTLSNDRLIQLVKLLARQAAEEDYAQSIRHSKSRW